MTTARIKNTAIGGDLKTISNAIDIIKSDTCTEEEKHEQLGCIADAIDNIESYYKDVRQDLMDSEIEIDELKEKIKEMEEEEDAAISHHITIADCRTNEQWNLESTAIYADNLTDQMALETFVKSLYNNFRRA